MRLAEQPLAQIASQHDQVHKEQHQRRSCDQPKIVAEVDEQQASARLHRGRAILGDPQFSRESLHLKQVDHRDAALAENVDHAAVGIVPRPQTPRQPRRDEPAVLGAAEARQTASNVDVEPNRLGARRRD